MLKLGDHRRRRVAGGPLPEAALHRGDEVEDPGADRDAERQDRRGRRMLGQRRGRGRERDRQAGVQQVAERDSSKLRRIDAAAVALPQQDARPAAATRSASRRAARAPSPHPPIAGIGCCSSSFSAPLCRSPATRRIATNGSRNDRRELAGAEGRRPDADQRRERFADAGRVAVQAAGLGVGAHGADERDADERSDDAAARPTTRRDAISSSAATPSAVSSAVAPRYVRARNTSSRSPAGAGDPVREAASADSS